MNTGFNQALQVVLNHGVIVYPTETFFALGGMGISSKVVAEIRDIKGRPAMKPLPLIAGSLEQCLKFVHLDDESLELAESFWPGPLSILAKAGEKIPLGVKDDQGLVSIRVTPHPLAVSLCLDSGFPLIATSANISGRPSCADYHKLDPEVLSRVRVALDSPLKPTGRLASTLVGVIGKRLLRLYREGEVTLQQLKEQGWDVEL